LREVFSSRQERLEALYRFYPGANPEEWVREVAGQRVQVIKPDPRKVGVLQFGTEVISSADGSIAGLLGASPGASTATAIMLEVLERCFAEKTAGWREKLLQMIPSLHHDGGEKQNPSSANMRRAAEILQL